MRYSILLATLGRTTELYQFFNSLSKQTYRRFDVIVIDQNPDGILQPILERYAEDFPIRRVGSAPGHSRAFNAGLAHVNGDIVAFPDDDCWYDPDLLARVAELLTANTAWSGVTGREIVEPGFTCGGRWDLSPGPLTRSNIFRRAISFSMFLRRSVAERYSFDETLGVGAKTRWGAGEETDYLLRIIQDGNVIQYDPNVSVWHQGRSGPYTTQTYQRAKSYGRGMGRVLRKHRYPLRMLAEHWIRPLGGALMSVASGRPHKARLHWSIFEGRVDGWLLKPGEERMKPENVGKRINALPNARLSSGEEIR